VVECPHWPACYITSSANCLLSAYLLIDWGSALNPAGQLGKLTMLICLIDFKEYGLHKNIQMHVLTMNNTNYTKIKKMTYLLTYLKCTKCIISLSTWSRQQLTSAIPNYFRPWTYQLNWNCWLVGSFCIPEYSHTARSWWTNFGSAGILPHTLL